MKRTPLQRRTPLKAASLQRGGSTLPRTTLKRTTRVAARSPKRELEAAARRLLVPALLAERPVCEARVRCRGARAVDVHERLKRSRGGNILDPDQAHMVTLCRACHEWTEDPDRWEPDPTFRRMLLPSWHRCPEIGPC
jgi:hypothetical protein